MINKKNDPKNDRTARLQHNKMKNKKIATKIVSTGRHKVLPAITADGSRDV